MLKNYSFQKIISYGAVFYKKNYISQIFLKILYIISLYTIQYLKIIDYLSEKMMIEKY
jgi:hypothetical protein